MNDQVKDLIKGTPAAAQAATASRKQMQVDPVKAGIVEAQLPPDTDFQALLRGQKVPVVVKTTADPVAQFPAVPKRGGQGMAPPEPKSQLQRMRLKDPPSGEKLTSICKGIIQWFQKKSFETMYLDWWRWSYTWGLPDKNQYPKGFVADVENQAKSLVLGDTESFVKIVRFLLQLGRSWSIAALARFLFNMAMSASLFSQLILWSQATSDPAMSEKPQPTPPPEDDPDEQPIDFEPEYVSAPTPEAPDSDEADIFPADQQLSEEGVRLVDLSEVKNMTSQRPARGGPEFAFKENDEV